MTSINANSLNMLNFKPPEIESIENKHLENKLRQRIDNKTKPIGALGILESLGIQLGLILNTDSPSIEHPQVCLFAADHGLTKHGISAYPSEVTYQMVLNILQGGAAINVFSNQHNLKLTVVDAGVASDFEANNFEANNFEKNDFDKNDFDKNISSNDLNNLTKHRPQFLTHYKIRHASRDALTEPAMTMEECIKVLDAGMSIAKKLKGNLLIVGEMGIGNTSAASLILARLGNIPIADCIGRGTGLDDAGLNQKLAILTQVLDKHKNAVEPLDALAALGGIEIAMMVGALIQGASERRVLLIDGFIASVALLVAERLAPNVVQYAVFGHHSEEPGHTQLLNLVDGKPLLSFNMRLGEGSGAALAYPIVQSACLFINEMASFESAGVSKKASVSKKIIKSHQTNV